MLTVPRIEVVSVSEPSSQYDALTTCEPASPTAIVDVWKEFKDSFQKRVLRVDCDSVGYGFVLRGQGPTYVQTVDPSGPAAKSGIRVGHIVQAVNGIDVIDMNHKETAKVILGRRLKTITITVLEQQP